MITDCPAFELSRREIFHDETIDTKDKWSVRDMLIFSYLPGVREAIDGDTDLGLFAYMDSEDDDEFDPP